MRTYINAQKPKTIAVVIHHSMLAAKIFAPPSTKVVAKPSEREDKKSDKLKGLTICKPSISRAFEAYFKTP